MDHFLKKNGFLQWFTKLIIFFFIFLKFLFLNNEIFIILGFIIIVTSLYFSFKSVLYSELKDKVYFIYFELYQLYKTYYKLSYKQLVHNHNFFYFSLNLYKSIFILIKQLYKFFILNYYMNNLNFYKKNFGFLNYKSFLLSVFNNFFNSYKNYINIKSMEFDIFLKKMISKKFLNNVK